MTQDPTPAREPTHEALRETLNEAAHAAPARGAEPEAFLLPRRLVDGYRDFMAGDFARARARFRTLGEEGQSPRILIIGCCDSRVAPELIFNASPGELFVVRNVANLVPPYLPNDDFHGTSAALEFAVMGLRIAHVVVLGHAKCGGVRAYAEAQADPYARPLSPGDFIGSWIRLIEPAARALPAPETVTDDYVERLAKQSIRASLDNLRSFPWVRALEERGLLSLHGAFFGVMDGQLEVLDAAESRFRPIGDNVAAGS